MVPSEFRLLLITTQMIGLTSTYAWLHAPFSYSSGSCTKDLNKQKPSSIFAATVESHDSDMTNAANSVMHSLVLGEVRRIEIPGQEADSSVLGALGVPTFAASGSVAIPLVPDDSSPRARGLDGVLQQGPAFVLPNALSVDACEALIADTEQLGFGTFKSGKNFHGAMQIVVSAEVADEVAQRLGPHIDVSQVEELRGHVMKHITGLETPDEEARLGFVGVNRRWRIYRYDSSGNETFAPHVDAGFPPSGLSEDGEYLMWDASNTTDGEIVSRLTVLIYLNDDFWGGETNFYKPASKRNPIVDGDNLSQCLIASVRPVAGSMLVFPQGVGEATVEYARQNWPLHEGRPLLPGSTRPKYVIRSDALFVTEKTKLPFEDKYSRYDHLVREAFMPNSRAFNSVFLSQAASLYNPHMGVENLGLFLYSLVRFTKKRRIVEIGAGYTSIWILQALKDNDDELSRARTLQRQGCCKLLDIEWTIAPILESFDNEPAQLICVDTCEHQKETATGALAVARSLGLDSYLDFRQGDAFELDLETQTVDILWCDFGVGSRIREFVPGAWASVAAGGLFLCHSTLTNSNTRDWLEDIRAREGIEKTGISPDEYTELSLLEPAKRFQNSITILQKRKDYTEPIYSQYA